MRSALLLALTGCTQVFGLDPPRLIDAAVNPPLDTIDSGGACVGDNFDDNVIGAQWLTFTNNNQHQLREQNQRLEIQFAPFVDDYVGIQLMGPTDIRDRSVQVRFAAAPQGLRTETYLGVTVDPNNQALFLFLNGELTMVSRVNSATDMLVVSFDATAHRYWRMSFDSSANRVRFDTSPDGTSWTPRTAAPWLAPMAKIELVGGSFSGGDPAPGLAAYDDFAIVTPTCTL